MFLLLLNGSTSRCLETVFTEEGHNTVTLVTLNSDLCKTDIMENVTRKNKTQKENKQQRSALFQRFHFKYTTDIPSSLKRLGPMESSRLCDSTVLIYWCLKKRSFYCKVLRIFIYMKSVSSEVEGTVFFLSNTLCKKKYSTHCCCLL